MQRRTFLSAMGIATAAQTAKSREMFELPVAPPLGSRLLLFDEANVAESAGVRLGPAPVERLGPALGNDSPGDAAGLQTAMGCGQFALEGGGYCLYYSARSADAPTSGIAIAESDDGLRWRKPALGQLTFGGKATNRIRIQGVPDDAHVTQPSMLKLARGGYRMYFWMHENLPPKRKRYLIASSADGLDWRCTNFDDPCLIHPHDAGKWGWMDGPESVVKWNESGLPTRDAAYARKRIRSNDAVHTYAMPSGGYEMFSVFPVLNTRESGRWVARDNAPFMIRVMTRRTSDDGLRWSDPEFIVVPDDQDPWDQQFYYLTQHRFGDLRIGFLGHYRVHDQTMDIEFAYSRDGRMWKRPLRGPWFARGPKDSGESGMLYMPNHLFNRGDHWLALYTGSDAVHNQPQTGRRGVYAAKIGMHRFAGPASWGSAAVSLRTKTFFVSGKRVVLDAKIGGELRAELCDAFGKPLAGFTLAESIPVRGDSTAHELKWKSSPASLYESYPASLRLEWRQGQVFGVACPDGRE